MSKETEKMVTTQPVPAEGKVWSQVACKAVGAEGKDEADEEGKEARDDGYGEGEDAEEERKKKAAEQGAEGAGRNESMERETRGSRRKKEERRSRGNDTGMGRGQGRPKYSPNPRPSPNDVYHRRSPNSPNSWDFEGHRPTFVVPKVQPKGRPGYKLRSLGHRNVGVAAAGMDMLHGDTLDGFGNGKEWLEKLMEMMRQRDAEPMENQDWYTQPLEMLVPQPPIPSQRLYRRQPTLLDIGLHLSSILEDNRDLDMEDSTDDTNIAKYLSQIKDILDRELGMIEDETGEKIVIEQRESEIMPKQDESFVECSCADDDEEEEIDLNISSLWNLSSPGSKVPTPVSKENEVLDDRPLFYLTKDLCDECPSPSNCELTPAASATGSSSCSPTCQTEATNWQAKLKQAHSSWLADQPEGDDDESTTKAQFSTCSEFNCDSQWRSQWQPLLICDNCKSNKVGMFGDRWASTSPVAPLCYSGKPGLWASYHDIIVPALGDKHSISSWQQLHAKDSTYDDDRPFDMSKSLSLLLSPKQQGGQTSQLWDVNVQRKYEFEAITEHSPLDNIQKYLLNVRFEGPISQNTASFIKGGLYGNSLGCMDNIWEQSTLLQDDVFHEEENDANLWHNFSCTPTFARHKCTSLNSEGDLTRLERSVELLPSENSAFKDSIPRRLTSLPHVQSEPILSIDKLLTAAEPCARLVQVKSVYKSDCSILSQLGLATHVPQPYEDEVVMSTDTHFRPICVTPHKTESAQSTPTQQHDQEEGSVSHSGSYSNYQMYHGEETCGASFFIPR